MKKQTLLQILNSQQLTTKKTTRRDYISLVASLVEKHIPANAEINGLSLNRSTSGVNLGDVVEVVAKSLFNNPLEKSDKSYDLTDNNKKVEVKFATTDAYAHPFNNEEVDYYMIITYSKKLGGKVFKIPFANKSEIDVNAQKRITTNQPLKFLDKGLTQRLFN